jgi:hypothetical protein
MRRPAEFRRFWTTTYQPGCGSNGSFGAARPGGAGNVERAGGRSGHGASATPCPGEIAVTRVDGVFGTHRVLAVKSLVHLPGPGPLSSAHEVSAA